MAAKKKTTRKTTAKKTTTKRAAAKPKKKTAAKRTTAKKPAARKTTAKRTTAKKTTRKAAPKKRTSAKKAPAKKANVSVSSPLTKAQLMTTIAEMTEVPKGEVSSVFEALNDIMAAHFKRRGPRKFTIPGIVKFDVVHKKAKKARKGINPFTGEETMFKAKPAHDVLKARLLKGAKEMVE